MAFEKSQLLTFLASVLLLWLNACSVENLTVVENETPSHTIETAITLTSSPPNTSPTVANYVKLPIIGGALISASQEAHLVEIL